jgi:iron complex outermembrane recepter protein
VEGHEVFSVRAAVAFEPWDWLDIDLNADFSRQRDDGPLARPVTPVVFGLSDSTATPALAPFDRYLRVLEDELGFLLTPLREALVAELIGGQVSHERRVVYQDSPTKTEIDSGGVGLTFGGTFENFGAKLITGYRDSRRDFVMDGDMTDFPALSFVEPNFTEGEQFSAELQLVSDFELPVLGGPVHVLGGGFYYREEASENIRTSLVRLNVEQLDALGDLIPPQLVPLFVDGGLSQILFDSEQATRSRAGFLDLEWRAVDWLRLHAGGRYTLDRKVVVGTVREPPGIATRCENERQADQFSATTWRFGVDFPFDEDRMLYASYSEGFKSGGFNPATCHSGPYKPEYVEAKEIGLKTQWFDGSLQVNAAVFRYDYTDIQVEKVVGFATSVVNGPTAKIDGAELAVIVVPFTDLTIDGAVSWIDARYGTFEDDDPFTQADPAVIDLSGNRLNKAPEWSGTVGLAAERILGSLGTVDARLEWSYTGRMFYDYFNHDFAEGPSYEIWNAFVNFRDSDERWDLQVFGKNLTNEFYWAGQVTPSAVVGGPFTYFGLPRTYGVAVTWHFGQ